ncbi:MAG TPA: hypothetical protein VM282_07775 [Acidimicrobiales bacterium]|nr:hypothetical protein [Acidimicrobiales bacterium]
MSIMSLRGAVTTFPGVRFTTMRLLCRWPSDSLAAWPRRSIWVVLLMVVRQSIA